MPTAEVPEGAVVKGMGMIESCPHCHKDSVVGTRKYSPWEFVVLGGLVLAIFPASIFYGFLLLEKEYEFKCSCGYKWSRMPTELRSR